MCLPIVFVVEFGREVSLARLVFVSSSLAVLGGAQRAVPVLLLAQLGGEVLHGCDDQGLHDHAAVLAVATTTPASKCVDVKEGR